MGRGPVANVVALRVNTPETGKSVTRILVRSSSPLFTCEIQTSPKASRKDASRFLANADSMSGSITTFAAV